MYFSKWNCRSIRGMIDRVVSLLKSEEPQSPFLKRSDGRNKILRISTDVETITGKNRGIS